MDIKNSIYTKRVLSFIAGLKALLHKSKVGEAEALFCDDVKTEEQICRPEDQVLEEENREIRSKTIVHEIIQMVHEEYDTDLTLEKCASRLNLHTNYIWRLMRSEMNTTFREYLSQYRLKMAKRWLKETDMPIGEIAEKLTYDNAANFIRYFKKLEGVTPGQYRESQNTEKRWKESRRR